MAQRSGASCRPSSSHHCRRQGVFVLMIVVAVVVGVGDFAVFVVVVDVVVTVIS
jgi:hypothetical protein